MRRIHHTTYRELIALLHEEHRLEREQWTRERQMLLDRIKPETAKNILLEPNTPAGPAHIRFDDDADYWASQSPTKDDLARVLHRDD